MKHHAVLFVLVLFASAGCKGREGTMRGNTDPGATPETRKDIRSPVAGSWYPGDPETLRRDIRRMLDSADVSSLSGYRGPVLGLISPHAGYRYSGGVAAHGYRLLEGRDVRRVVVLGPSHQVPFRGLAIPDATHWITPLGEVPLDREALARLRQAGGVFATREDAFLREHSVDMQIPFLQVVAPGATLVPVVVGQVGPAEAREAAAALRGIVDDHTVIVASSDFTHYGPNYGYLPFRDRVPERLEDLAMQAAKALGRLDLEGFQAHLRSTGDTICGAGPILVMLATLPAGSEAVSLRFDTSGRMTGDFANSVSYFSIAFLPARGPVSFEGVDLIDGPTRSWLLDLARETLRRHLAGRPLPDPVREGREVPPKARETYGVFVTLKKHGDLRGCIGSIVGTEPLYQGVLRNAVNAASHDPRFAPMTAAEEPEVEIEISVLTPLKEVPSFQDIRVGRDGVLIEKGGRRAVFLPQVAPEQGWDLATMLTHLSMKAGLAPDAWKSGARFQTFQAHVFHEAH
ncbi:AmmeMemoRadiSam system protein B [Myxococcota bacterium]|nr:AmmeMemoRadiSam system protein B [Myxococcota bacterium]